MAPLFSKFPGGDPEVEARGLARGLGADRGLEVARRPHEERALVPLGVGVLRGVEGARGVAHLGEEVGDELARRRRVARRAGGAPPVDVEAEEERVVVEHLLEVGDEPALVGRVAVEAAAEVIPDPAFAHAIEGEL